MKILSLLPTILCALFLIGCAVPNSLMITNTFSQPATLRFDFEGTIDSAVVAQGSASTVLSDAIASSSPSDEYRLRTVTVNEPDGTVRIYRFSNTYLASKQWALTLPFHAQDTIPPRSLDARKYYLMGRDNTLYHVAQEYYNSGEYEKCFYLLDGFFRSGAVDISVRRANTTGYQTTFDAERERYIGIQLLMFLCKKKGSLAARRDQHLDEVARLAPDYMKYLLKNDVEFAP